MQLASRFIAVLVFIFVTAAADGQSTFHATSGFACGTCRCGPQQNIVSFSPIVSQGSFSDPTSVAHFFTVADRGLIICRRTGNAWAQICIGFGGGGQISANDLIFSGPPGATTVANVSWSAQVATEFVSTGGGSEGGATVSAGVGPGGIGINAGIAQSFQSYATSGPLTSGSGTVSLGVAYEFNLNAGAFTLTPYYGIDCIGESTLHFPAGQPVFNLPPGYTVNCPSLNIVNNFWMGTEKYPFVMAQPSAEDACVGADASFNVTATGESLQYQWRRDGMNLSDGPSGGGSSITGAHTTTLQITGMNASDQGSYDVVVSNEFGHEISDLAALTLTNLGCNVAPTCAVDVGLNVANPDGSYTATVGEAFTAIFIGSDDDEDDTLTVGGNLPSGALLTPSVGASAIAPLPAIFSWTPSDADAAGNPHTVEVSFADAAGESSTCSLQINVNRRPVALCGGSITAEAASAAGALVELNGGASSDPDDATLLYHWDVSVASVALDNAESAITSGVFPIGVTMATLTVADGRGGVTTCDVTVTVQDTTPPEVMVTTNLASLWPPNHTMRPVQIIVTTTDANFDPEDVIPLMITVRSDEPDNAPGNGDGNTTGDVHGSDGYSSPVNITSQFTFNPALGVNGAWEATINLRAERAGSGDGRAYTIDVTAFDSQMNFANTSCVVVVPHDRRGE